MIIREAQFEDLDSVKLLYAQLNPTDEIVSDGSDAAVFKNIIASEHLFLFVGVLEGKIITTCYLNVIPNISRNVTPYAIIENVVTDQEQHNKGYGKITMKHALECAWSQGCYKVMLQTGSRREATHNFYKSCGFSANDKFAFVARST